MHHNYICIAFEEFKRKQLFSCNIITKQAIKSINAHIIIVCINCLQSIVLTAIENTSLVNNGECKVRIRHSYYSSEFVLRDGQKLRCKNLDSFYGLRSFNEWKGALILKDRGEKKSQVTGERTNSG